MVPDVSRRDRMVAMYQRGVAPCEIAREFGVLRPAVSSALKRAGVIVRDPRPMPGDFREKAGAGMATKQLMRHYGAGAGVVQRWIREMGGKPRAKQWSADAPAPDDFSRYASIETVAQLVKRYGVGTKKVARWRREVDAASPPRPTRITKPMPEGFAMAAPNLTLAEICARFGIGRTTVKKWCADAKVKPATPRRTYAGASSAMGRAKPAMTALNRDTSRAGQAADFLRRFGPVVRCDEAGRYKPDGDHWRRGSTVLTADEVIARAVRNGWQPDAWKALAA